MQNLYIDTVEFQQPAPFIDDDHGAAYRAVMFATVRVAGCSNVSMVFRVSAAHELTAAAGAAALYAAADPMGDERCRDHGPSVPPKLRLAQSYCEN
jgi:hypothetical protein